MKDIFKQELNIGDIVAFNEPSYKGLRIGTVEKFTPKMVSVKYVKYGKDEESCFRYPFDLCKKLS